MLHLIACLSFVLSFTSSALAVFSDDAYHVDYHHALLGLPQEHTTFFHRPRKDDKASLLYTLSDQGVLGAVNPGTGALVWRQFLAANTNRTFGGSNGIQGFLRAAEDEEWVVSAVGGYVNSWDALTGRERWYNEFEGFARDLEILETAGGELEKDTLVLFEQQKKGVLRRLKGATGDVAWEFHLGASDIPLQISTNVQSIFVIGLHGSKGAYDLKITTLDPVNGNRLDERTLSTSRDITAPQDVQFVGANMASPIIAWMDKTTKNVKVNILGSKQIHTLTSAVAGESIVKVAVHAPHLVQSQPHFLVYSQSETSHWADVYHIDIAAGTVSQAYHLPKLSGKGAFSTSSQDANVYFTRSSEDEITVVSSVSHGILSRFPVKTEKGTGSPVHAVSEVVSRSSTSFAVRSACLTTEDNWILIRNGALTWKRLEGLSGGIAAAWAEIPEDDNLAETLEAEAHSSPLSAYLHRVRRHITELQYFPAYIQKLPGRFMSSLFSTDVSAPTLDVLKRDSFGFRKLVIIATERGRVYALDTAAQGTIVWSTKVQTIPSGSKWAVKGLFVDSIKGTATIIDDNGERYILQTMDGTFETPLHGTVKDHLGHEDPKDRSGAIQAAAIISGLQGQFLMPVGRGGVLDSLEKSWAPKETFVVRGRNGEVEGVRYKTLAAEALPTTVWSFQPVPDQRIISVSARPTHDPVASIGLALGDRTVLYKYLNPNNILVTAVSDKLSTASFYLLDGVSGEVLYSTTHDGVDISQPITSVVSENWFAYSLWGDATAESNSTLSKGYQLIVSDMFESDVANDRGPLGTSGNYSSLSPSHDILETPILPYVTTQSFLVPEQISHMAVTQTRQGITSRQLLCTLGSTNGIVGLPRSLLNPRRPVGRDPVPKEMEEGLMRYVPVIDFNPQWVITHERQVVGIKNVITSPALLESTSLVFAYGVDVFGTRVMPSLAFDILGKGFNRVALVATVVALAVAVGVVSPMVRRKQINGRWRSS